jgi:hypothetical protein
VAPIEGVEQAPLQAPCERLTGDWHAHLLEPLRAFTESLGFTVSFEPIAAPAGGSVARTRSGPASARTW